MKTPKLSVDIQVPAGVAVVIPESREKIRKSGIVIPDTLDGKPPSFATLLVIGEPTETCDTRFFKAGDRVILSQYGGEDVQFTDDKGEKVTVKFVPAETLRGKIV